MGLVEGRRDDEDSCPRRHGEAGDPSIPFIVSVVIAGATLTRVSGKSLSVINEEDWIFERVRAICNQVEIESLRGSIIAEHVESIGVLVKSN